MDTLIKYALRSGDFVSINNVEKGDFCTCIECGNSLIIRKGSIRTHHFSHKQHTKCNGGIETIIHLKAKEVIQSKSKLLMPDHEIGIGKISSSFDEIKFKIEKRIAEFDNVLLEKKHNTIIPDVIAFESENKFFIEIFVTNKVSGEKIDKLKKLNITTLEIHIPVNSIALSDADFEQGVLYDFNRLFLHYSPNKDESIKIDNIKNRLNINNMGFSKMAQKSKEEYIRLFNEGKLWRGYKL